MPIAAVPQYLGQDFQQASPGLRFGMYLKLWGINRRTQALLWETHDIDYEARGQQREEREVKYENKVPALSEAKRLTDNDQKIMRELAARQSALTRTIPGEQLLRLDALAIAPFTTGLGNEHPLENGFAFLNPYGLPYLPGSGVKGVLRQAAHELASGEWGDTHGWSTEPGYPLMQGEGVRRRPVHDSRKQPVVLSPIDVLFGRQTPQGDSDHVRGALSFWDIIPLIKGDHLAVEIMTPHQGHYYQQKQERKAGDSTTPHESGQPQPNSFLTVPPGSSFTFHVRCDRMFLAKIAPGLAKDDQWKELLRVAFEHAFDWLGFGAKTAVGYGAMRARNLADVAYAEGATQGAGRDQSRMQASITVWPSATLTFNPGTGEISAVYERKSSLKVKGDDAQALLDALGKDSANKLRKRRELKSIAVRVEILGNQIKLLGLDGK